MIQQLPYWIDTLFVLAIVYSLVFFYLGKTSSGKVTLLVILWSVFHLLLALRKFYENTDAFPPRFALVIMPVILAIVIGFIRSKSSDINSQRNLTYSTAVHFVRFPVEIVLFQLYSYQLLPKMMTFSGLNFDILAGITAPIMAFLFAKGFVGRRVLLTWNILGLILILFVFGMGILTAELPFQQFAFEQPNRGMVYAPYVLLPATIVPIVIWTHLMDIRYLLHSKKE